MVQIFVIFWEKFKGWIDKECYEYVLFWFIYQVGYLFVWCDSVNQFYFNKSGIFDEFGCVGNYKYRIEVEEMEFKGYKLYRVFFFEVVSGYYCVVIEMNSIVGIVMMKFKVLSGKYDFVVNYYDMVLGNLIWELFVDRKLVGKWKGDLEYEFGWVLLLYIDGQMVVRKMFRGVRVKKGSEFKVVGRLDGLELVLIDYILVLFEGIVD